MLCRLHVRFSDSPSLSSNYQLILEEGSLSLPLPPSCQPYCLAFQARPYSPSAWSPRSTHAVCSHCISGLHRCHGNSVIAQVSGSSGCDLSPRLCCLSPGSLQLQGFCRGRRRECGLTCRFEF